MSRVSPMQNLIEVQEAVRVVQQPVYGPTVVRRICMRCQQPLGEYAQETDLAFCSECLTPFSGKRDDALVISIDGRSTLNAFLELQLWKTIDMHIRMNERGFERFLVVFLEEKMKEVVREEMWRKYPGSGRYSRL
jgi:hypothetical protein